ncbi:AMP-binding protein [Immundisolibacter sp.]|uniref:AMP-binding protein n=1 Tax=Immundisolibacter sp. TaxID=1934948 RepID=UPI00356A7A05
MEPLLVKHIVERAAVCFPQREIVARGANDTRFVYSYAAFYGRLQRAAHLLDRLGASRGQTVGVLGWNTHRHLELDYAAICKGAIYLGLNFRLDVEALVYTCNLAQVRVLAVDPELLPLAEALVAAGANTIGAFVLLGDDTELPRTALAPLHRYEELLAQAPPEYAFPDDIDENATVCVSFTGGTTGRPKGCPYSNRFLVLRALTRQSAQSLGPYRGDDVLLVIPPMFHAHAFNLPMDGMIAGAKLVLPGVHPDGHVVARLIADERVTRLMANPVLGKLVLAAAAERDHDLSSLRYVGFGGDIVPRDMAQRFLAMGVKLRCGGHGMAESLADHTAAFYEELAGADPASAFARMLDENSGLPIVGAQVRIIREDGAAVAADGVETGEIQLKGWHVIAEYFRDAANTEALFTSDGWLRTGDVGVRFADSSIAFVGRTKDMIKSGGEWIPALTLEHALSEHPAVAEACVIGVPHPTYGERPLALVTARPNQSLDPAALRDHLAAQLPRWMLPECLLLDDIAKTTVGKFNKTLLRERYRGHYAP